MATNKQKLGLFGEEIIAKYMGCPRCKRFPTLCKLPNNFKCADIICNFCGFLAQVKTKMTENLDTPPKTIPGAAWRPQNERIKHGIYFPLYLILVNKKKEYQIYYLPVDFQFKGLFKKRNPLSETAKRKGWQGFHYDFSKLSDGALVKVTGKFIWFNTKSKKGYMSF